MQTYDATELSAKARQLVGTDAPNEHSKLARKHRVAAKQIQEAMKNGNLSVIHLGTARATIDAHRNAADRHEGAARAVANNSWNKMDAQRAAADASHHAISYDRTTRGQMMKMKKSVVKELRRMAKREDGKSRDAALSLLEKTGNLKKKKSDGQ